MNNRRTLKGLETKLGDSLEEKKALENDIGKKRERLKKVSENVKNIKGEISKINTGPAVVTEHAIMKFFEIILGIDMEEIRSQILPEHVEKQIALLGDGDFPVNCNGISFKVRVRNNTIVTIIE